MSDSVTRGDKMNIKEDFDDWLKKKTGKIFEKLDKSEKKIILLKYELDAEQDNCRKRAVIRQMRDKYEIKTTN